MSKLLKLALVAGFGSGLNLAMADTVDTSSALSQYKDARQRCVNMSPSERDDCLDGARVRYESAAIMNCELLAGRSKQQCYRNVQATAGGRSMPSSAQATAGAEPVTSAGGEEKPGRQ